MVNRSDVFEGLRVLVVEDEGLIAEDLRDRLSRMGMNVVATVDSADTAVASAIAMRPDLASTCCAFMASTSCCSR